MKKLLLLLAFLGVVSFGCASQANAGVHVGIGIGTPGYYYGPGAYYGGYYGPYGGYPYYSYYGSYPYYGYYGHPYHYYYHGYRHYGGHGYHGHRR